MTVNLWKVNGTNWENLWNIYGNMVETTWKHIYIYGTAKCGFEKIRFVL